MKARTALQKRIMSEVAKLPPLTIAQQQAAKLNTLPHIAKRTADGYCYCLECGECWHTDDTAEEIVCPHCHTRLQFDNSRQRNFRFRDYFLVITKRSGFQLLRMFFIQSNLRKGMAAQYSIAEAFQWWINADGKAEVVGRKRNAMGHYYDSWDWSSPMELRREHYAHYVVPEYIYSRILVIDNIKRNGFRGDFHDISPRALFTAVLTDSRMETLLKANQIELLRHCIRTNNYHIDNIWKAARIAIRNHYAIKEADLWSDMLETLLYLGKDITNPKFVCPDNINEAHDYWMKLKDARLAKERERREREREQAEADKYLADTAKVEADEADYRRSKSRFFDININDDEITIRPLQSVREFMDEARRMHHCCFSNRYFAKPDSLVLHAIINGSSVETIEVDLRSFEVVQSRGVYNQRSEYHEQILSLMQANMGEVVRRLRA